MYAYCLATTLRYERTLSFQNQLYIVDTIYEFVDCHCKVQRKETLAFIKVIQEILMQILGITELYESRNINFDLS